MVVMRSARVALSVVFFVNGAVLSSWAPRIPAVKDSLGLDEPQLGIALFGIAVGSVPALLTTGRLLRVHSSRSVCRVAGLVFAGALPLIGMAGGLASLTLALVLLGAASGALDVGMNTAAVELESTAGSALMPGFHGAYSAGVLAGAVGGGAAAASGVPVLQHFVVVAASLLLLLGAAWSGLPLSTRHSPAPVGRAVGSGRRFVLLIPLAISALLLEGALTDWTAVLATGPPFTDATVAAMVIAAFSAAMVVSRTATAWLLHVVGQRAVVYMSSLILLVTIPSATLQSSPLILLAGIVLAGLAIGPLFPMVMSAAGAHDPANAGPATARVTAWGYSAYLGGPPAVGLLAGQVGLPVALAIVGAGASLVLLTLGRIGLAQDTQADLCDNGDRRS